METVKTALKTIRITPADDRYTIRAALHGLDRGARVLIVLGWDIEKGWKAPLDFEVLLREAQARELEIAWAVEDFERRPLVRDAGFPVFGSLAAVEAHLDEHSAFPALKAPIQPEQPKRPWWAPEPRRPKLPLKRKQPLWLIALELILLAGVLAVVIFTGLLSVPSAKIVLHPSGVVYSRVVPVSVDPDLDAVDLQRGVIPSRRIGDEFEGYAEVSTSGRGFSFSGRAVGRVLFTNLLGQPYAVPSGTVVRTTAGSYPVRFETTQDVTVPAFGQAEASIEALEEGPRGNVEPYQINLVEGVAGFAVRVTNPYATAGAESTTVATVSEADRERAWDLAAQKVLAGAYSGLQNSEYLEPGEFLPNQALVIQAAPKVAYTHLVGEESPTMGLSLHLLVTGQAVKASHARAVAYRQLATQVPEGYTLIDAQFSVGEAAEEDVGPGLFTFYVTTQGYASADIDTEAVLDMILGKPIDEAEAMLMERLALARPPEITVTPEWFPYLPFLPIRTQVQVVPGQMGDN